MLDRPHASGHPLNRADNPTPSHCYDMIYDKNLSSGGN